MYKKSAQGWLKHWDFMLLDFICMQVSLILAHILPNSFQIPYKGHHYLNLMLICMFCQVIVIFFGQPYKNILRRGYYLEFAAVFKQVCIVMSLTLIYLFAAKESGIYSRTSIIFTSIFYFLFSYLLRLILKKYIKTSANRKNYQNALVLIADENTVEQAVADLFKDWSREYRIAGIVLIDKSRIGDSIQGIPIVGDATTVIEYICREWVDEVFIKTSTAQPIPKKIIDALIQMGVTIHLSINELDIFTRGEKRIEKIGENVVLTSGIRMVSQKQVFCKRIIDIIGGVVGCIFIAIITFIIGPAIYIQSPGPIFFSQVRVGKNGKRFKIYKFRSMYLDAEERKKDLEKQNKVKDGFMFKMDHDPRIIGSEKIKKNGKPGGIGNFIRKTSLDEFPQFWNVLKGDMSLVGTRPPTLDEWEKYELHHRARMAIKPGITGLWQISGRSEITDFEEVVRLDTEYIEKWNIGLDIKILFMTVVRVAKNDGAM